MYKNPVEKLSSAMLIMGTVCACLGIPAYFIYIYAGKRLFGKYFEEPLITPFMGSGSYNILLTAVSIAALVTGVLAFILQSRAINGTAPGKKILAVITAISATTVVAGAFLTITGGLIYLIRSLTITVLCVAIFCIWIYIVRKGMYADWVEHRYRSLPNDRGPIVGLCILIAAIAFLYNCFTFTQAEGRLKDRYMAEAERRAFAMFDIETDWKCVHNTHFLTDTFDEPRAAVESLVTPYMDTHDLEEYFTKNYYTVKANPDTSQLISAGWKRGICRILFPDLCGFAGTFAYSSRFGDPTIPVPSVEEYIQETDEAYRRLILEDASGKLDERINLFNEIMDVVDGASVSSDSPRLTRDMLASGWETDRRAPVKDILAYLNTEYVGNILYKHYKTSSIVGIMSDNLISQ